MNLPIVLHTEGRSTYLFRLDNGSITCIRTKGEETEEFTDCKLVGVPKVGEQFMFCRWRVIDGMTAVGITQTSPVVRIEQVQ